jgi:hypothetical protein
MFSARTGICVSQGEGFSSIIMGRMSPPDGLIELNPNGELANGVILNGEEVENFTRLIHALSFLQP